MVHRIKLQQTNKNSLIIFLVSLVLSVIGLADSIYLLVYKLTGNPYMCLGNGGCHNVNFSPYSMIYGIPVSAFGIIAFLVILCILYLETRLRFFSQNGPLAIFGISLGGVAFTLYLTYIEVYIIHAICPFCVTAATIIFLIFILAIIRLATQTTI